MLVKGGNYVGDCHIKGHTKYMYRKDNDDSFRGSCIVLVTFKIVLVIYIFSEYNRCLYDFTMYAECLLGSCLKYIESFVQLIVLKSVSCC